MFDRPEHLSVGDPCGVCKLPASVHRYRPEHKAEGDPCVICGAPERFHRNRGNRKRNRNRDYDYRPEHLPDGNPCKKCGYPANNHRIRHRKFTMDNHEQLYIGIDGEGQGRRTHKYVILAASAESGSPNWWIRNPDGLSTIECLEFFLSLPSYRAKFFAYSFNYDLTKILEDVDNKSLYYLFRPELRQRFGDDAYKGPKPVLWQGYKLNLQGTKFTLTKGHRTVVIWDVWKFFQSKFVGALTDWKIGEHEMRERMTLMKDKRSEFDKVSWQEVLAYCLEECQYMAELARKLTEAHTSAGIKLTNYYGAGSSASGMLKNMGIKEKIVKPPKEMRKAVASAFFGGRFENSIIGKEETKVYSFDISSAYPYQLCFLPCLLHGTWELTTDRKKIEKARTALIHYKLGPNPGINTWGPFPFRTDTGSICFPATSGGGWIWKDEYLQGERLFPHVEFIEAWIYHCDCSCMPFERIPEYYCERCRIGKEGPGIVIKLGCNSCYGKLAQSIGRGVYNSWVWAGLITSGCRAQILEVLGLHRERRNLLMVATDGIYTREDLVMPTPRDTNTNSTGKPLGGWERKVIDKGVFVARPGVYFPLNPTKKEIKDIRGRGVGKGVILENWKMIVDSWENHKLNENVKVANVSRFCGAKSCISRAGKPGHRVYRRADGTNDPIFHRAYGQWITRYIELSFNPMPKREGVNPDGKTLTVRSFPRDIESIPYSKALVSYESRLLKLMKQEMLEQPDIDLSDYEITEEDDIISR